jgi:hypothetical protein
MSTENVRTALQAFESTGNGLTLTLRDARFLTFKIQGNEPVTAGQITIERTSMPTAGGNTPMLSSGGWTVSTTIPVPANAMTEWFAGGVSGTFRARISPPITGGTVTVLAIRSEEQRGMPLRPSWVLSA